MLEAGLTFRLRQTTRRIIIHDSHTPRHVPSALDYMRAKGRTMGLLDVGYHFVIERNGMAKAARPMDSVGSHTPGCNWDSVSVCLAGGEAGVDDFTTEQVETLLALTQALAARYSIPVKEGVRGHSECVRRKGPQCPALDMHQFRQTLLNDETQGPLMDPQATEAPTPKAGLTFQQQTIVDYLTNRGELTNLHALVSLGIGSITSRIAELRAKGYVITSTGAKDFHGKDYVRYALVSLPDGSKPKTIEG